MDVLAMTATYLEQAVLWIWWLSRLVAVLMCVWALIDALTHASSHFVAAGKRSKGFWVGVNLAGIAVMLLMGVDSMLGLLGVITGAVYLADVRPALRLYSPVRVRSSIRFPGRSGQGRPGRGPGRAGPGSGPRDWRPGR